MLIDDERAYTLTKYSGKYHNTKCVQRHVYFVNVQLSLCENVVYSVCAPMTNTEYIIPIMWNFLSGLETWNHIRFNISCGCQGENSLKIKFR